MTRSIQNFAKLACNYILVGGGTAGLAVAARLSEDPQINVGVIEAGPSALKNRTHYQKAIGTCAMSGKEGINDGVVDERLRAYGVCGLRVIDASIMALQIKAQAQATVQAIAEKGSAMIREYWVDHE
ncbi:choline dehydrogenase [Penicillium sp. IBT 18751x]|nr:choline dehydrogenase [Penicillium sp. IBT 18751x]